MPLVELQHNNDKTMVNYLQATISFEVKHFNKAKYNFFSLWVKLLALCALEIPLLVWGICILIQIMK